MAQTVFYAWQSDRSQKLHRYLIRDAATAACKRITEDQTNAWQVQLDEATLGAPGMCDIPNTILEKIRGCTVFLGDLTFVGRSDAADHQPASNPNVVFELGFAAAAVGFERIIGVMNVVHGQPERQMFDVKRRWAIRYEAPDAADSQTLKNVGATLSKDIEAAIRTILVNVSADIEPAKVESRFVNARHEFEQTLRNGRFHGLVNRKELIAVTVVPDAVVKIDHRRLQRCVLEPPIQRTFQQSWEPEIRGSSVLAVASVPDANGAAQIRYAISEFTTDAVFRAANARVMDAEAHRNWQRRSPGGNVLNDGKYIPSIDLENTIVDTITASLARLGELGVRGSIRVGISLLGIQGFCLLADQHPSQVTFQNDDIIVDPVEISCSSPPQERYAVGTLLKDAFDFIWREFGFPGSRSYDSTGNWHSRRGHG